MRKDFVEKTFKKSLSLPPIDGIRILDEEREFTTEEWDYYLELVDKYSDKVTDGGKKWPEVEVGG